jgi:hypothetical protein
MRREEECSIREVGGHLYTNPVDNGPKNHDSAHTPVPVIPSTKINEVKLCPKTEVRRPRADSRKINDVVDEMKGRLGWHSCSLEHELSGIAQGVVYVTVLY